MLRFFIENTNCSKSTRQKFVPAIEKPKVTTKSEAKVLYIESFTQQAQKINKELNDQKQHRSWSKLMKSLLQFSELKEKQFLYL